MIAINREVVVRQDVQGKGLTSIRNVDLYWKLYVQAADEQYEVFYLSIYVFRLVFDSF